jgi:ribosomal protein S8
MSKPIIIDTNILIGFDRWIPRKTYSIFWNNLEEKISEGRIILLDVVMNEIKGDLRVWCKTLKQKGFLSTISSEDRFRALQINQQYPMIDNVTMKSQVDTWIIAYAERNQYMICSRETRKQPNKRIYKIPDTCDALSIEVTSKPSGLYSRTGLGFI